MNPFDTLEHDIRKTEIHVLTNFHKSLSKESERIDQHPDIPHVSSFVYECLRRAYYNITQKHQPVDMRGAITMWIGRKVHETQILKGGHMETKFYYGTMLQGTIDEYDDLVLMDKKTTRFIPRKPYKHHIKQLQLYAMLLKYNQCKVPPFGCILYIDVDDSSVKPFVFTLDVNHEELQEEVEFKYDLLHKSLNTKILPPRTIQPWDDDVSKTVCSYCNFYNKCWAEDYTEQV